MKVGNAEIWFTEDLEIDRGHALTVRVNKILAQEESAYQKLAVLDTQKFGRMLVLDGAIQCTEFDEYAYQEMITHPAMCAHPSPKRVLVIGGGDGGVLREVVRHPDLVQVDLCEIDEKVIELSRKYLPSMACGFEHSKVKVHVRDGFEFMKENRDQYDVIIVDSSDPIGPAVSLFQEPFFGLVFNALNDGGIFVNQCENIFWDSEFAHKVMEVLSGMYRHVDYYYCHVPTYPGGCIGFCFASKVYSPRECLKDRHAAIEGTLKYYHPDMHQASFVLPAFFYAGAKIKKN